MTRIVAGLAVSFAVLAATSGAMAADLVVQVEETAIDYATPSNWDGLYVGAGIVFESSTTDDQQLFGIQGSVGVNATFDSFLLGAEAFATAYVWESDGDPLFFGFGGIVRGGVLASDDVLVYAALGGEIDDDGSTYATVGGGVEFMAMEDLSLDLEYKYFIGLNNDWQGHHVSLSANWHF